MNLIKYITNWKYRFFYRKVWSVNYTIAEVEFKISKSRQIREGVRQDRDRAKEALNQMDAALNAAKDDVQKEKITAEKKAMEENVIRYEKQMKMIDDQINGAAGTETSDPIIGLMEQIKSYIELKMMYQQHMKEI